MEQPKYKHSYPYPCTFLGSFTYGPTTTDLYHTKTFEGPMLISRYGDKSLEFEAESTKNTKVDAQYDYNHMGEAYRRAEKQNLEL